jgi:hypothetical protein
MRLHELTEAPTAAQAFVLKNMPKSKKKSGMSPGAMGGKLKTPTVRKTRRLASGPSNVGNLLSTQAKSDRSGQTSTSMRL